MAVIAFIEAEDVIEKILQRRTSPQTPRSMGSHAQACLRAPHRQASAPDGQITALYTEPHIDYSHRDVGPYGPEADTQVCPSDNGFYVETIPACA